MGLQNINRRYKQDCSSGVNKEEVPEGQTVFSKQTDKQ